MRKVLQDIVNGKNIDLYALVAFAISYFLITVLNKLGWMNLSISGWENKLIIGFLGVQAIATLKNRKVDEEVHSIVSRSSSTFIKEFPTNFKSEVEAAKKLRIVTSSLDIPGIDNIEHIISNKLRNNQEVEVLMTSPHGPGVDIACQRATWESKSSKIRRLEADIDRLENINKKHNGLLQVKLINNPLPYMAILVTPPKARLGQTIYMAHYPFQTEKTKEPKHVIKESDAFFHLYSEELDNLWAYPDTEKIEKLENNETLSLDSESEVTPTPI
ncbi:TPA: hypothetical protein ACGUXQ_004432, partial [Vibrio vulnificus]